MTTSDESAADEPVPGTGAEDAPDSPGGSARPRNRPPRPRSSDSYTGCDIGDSCNHCEGGCDNLPLDCPMFLSVSRLILLASIVAGIGNVLLGRIPVVRRHRRGGAGIVLAAIRVYRRWLSPRIPVRCRYVPSCSAFGLEAIQRYGLEIGGRLAADRIRNCRAPVPFGTHDPVETHAARSS